MPCGFECVVGIEMTKPISVGSTFSGLDVNGGCKSSNLWW